jgi:chromosome segregation ATPase
MRDIESRKHQAHERAGSIERQIMAVELDIKHHHQRLPDLSRHLDGLKDERDALLDKLQNLNSTYEHAVKDISRERAQMEAHNRRHCQLMAAKAMEKAFSEILFERKQYAFNEFEAYCKFDKNCHDTLKRLTQVMLNCGQFQLKISLKRWFQNALKPLDTRLQGTQLADAFHRHKLKLRYIKQWQTKHRQAAQKHENKLKAAMRIWRLKQKDCRKIAEEFFIDWRIASKLRE